MHEHYNHHDHHDHESSMRSPEAAAQFLRRFYLVTALLVPLVALTPTVRGWLNIPSFFGERYFKFALATAIFAVAGVFFTHARHEIAAKKYGMMTLVSLAVLAGYLFSAAGTFWPGLEMSFYVEISTLVWVLLFGHFLEARSSSAAGDALSAVAELLPQTAHRVTGDQIEEVAVGDLKMGDIVQVRAGEKIPADGEIVSGEGSFNEALISGESAPIAKRKGDTVAAGAICDDGAVRLKLTRVGEHSTVGQIKQLVAAAQMTKPAAARLADLWAGRLTFVALAASILTVLIWSVGFSQPLIFSLTLAITVLVIACPHALGLAIPAVTTITTRLAVKNGLFIKDLAALERAARVDAVIFDKTGTLTTGQFIVQQIVPFSDQKKKDILPLMAALEKESAHVIARAVVTAAKKAKLTVPAAGSIKVVAGQGLAGVVNNHRYLVGNKLFLKSQGVWVAGDEKSHQALAKTGHTVVYLADEKTVLGAVTLADSVKPAAKEAIITLHKMGVEVEMLTGDNQAVAAAVAKSLSLDRFVAEVQPADKLAAISQRQQSGQTVIMVGDGVNDAPALKQADVGLAIGSGTDVAVEAGDVVLTASNPVSVARFVTLSRAAVRKMRQNLVWALGYNIVAIPAAAGLFIPLGWRLRPEIGALVMSLSTVIVVLNSFALLRHPDFVRYNEGN